MVSQLVSIGMTAASAEHPREKYAAECHFKLGVPQHPKFFQWRGRKRDSDGPPSSGKPVLTKLF